MSSKNEEEVVEIKTTQKQFKVFKTQVEESLVELGLQGWKVYIEWDNDGCKHGRYASCTAHLSGRTATITLAKTIEIRTDAEDKTTMTDEDVKQYAKHECLHLLLWRLSSLGEYRYVTKEELAESEHEVIRVLEKLI